MKYLIIFFFFCVSLIINAQENYRLNINNINLPFDNKGVLADVNIPPDGSGGRYDSIVFLFSGGFFLTGINADTIWANAVATASLVNDYQPGPVVPCREILKIKFMLFNLLILLSDRAGRITLMLLIWAQIFMMEIMTDCITLLI